MAVRHCQRGHAIQLAEHCPSEVLEHPFHHHGFLRSDVDWTAAAGTGRHGLDDIEAAFAALPPDPGDCPTDWTAAQATVVPEANAS